MPVDPRRVRTMSDLVRAEAERMRAQARALGAAVPAAPDTALSTELGEHGRRCAFVAGRLDRLAVALDAHAAAVTAPPVRRHLPELAAAAGLGAALGVGALVAGNRAAGRKTGGAA